MCEKWSKKALMERKFRKESEKKTNNRQQTNRQQSNKSTDNPVDYRRHQSDSRGRKMLWMMRGKYVNRPTGQLTNWPTDNRPTDQQTTDNRPTNQLTIQLIQEDTRVRVREGKSREWWEGNTPTDNRPTDQQTNWPTDQLINRQSSWFKQTQELESEKENVVNDEREIRQQTTDQLTNRPTDQ